MALIQADFLIYLINYYGFAFQYLEKTAVRM